MKTSCFVKQNNSVNLYVFLTLRISDWQYRQDEWNEISLVHEPLFPTTPCTPPHDDYYYDCDVNRGPTFNHVHTGVSLLPHRGLRLRLRADRRARCSSLRFLTEIERVLPTWFARQKRQKRAAGSARYSNVDTKDKGVGDSKVMFFPLKYSRAKTFASAGLAWVKYILRTLWAKQR